MKSVRVQAATQPRSFFARKENAANPSCSAKFCMPTVCNVNFSAQGSGGYLQPLLPKQAT